MQSGVNITKNESLAMQKSAVDSMASAVSSAAKKVSKGNQEVNFDANGISGKIAYVNVANNKSSQISVASV
jgi:hypothetical protein